MEQFSFVLTIFFMLLGPVKIIPAFAKITQGYEEHFKHSVAIRAALIASVVVAFVALAGENLVGKYRISLDSLRIAGGLVLLLAAINTIFPKAQPQPSHTGNATPMQLAVSPVATPIIVPTAGVAAILIFTMLASEYAGMMYAVAVALAIIMVLDFLAMYFNSKIIKVPGLIMVLQVLGAVLVFMQAALAIETILIALRHMGVILS